MRDDTVVYLEISTFQGYGGVHWYGTLKNYTGNSVKSIDLMHPLSEKEAAYLNRNSLRDYRFVPGLMYRGWTDKQALIAKAIEVFKDHFPSADILILGRASYAEPQPVLVAPEEISKKINGWFEQCEKLGWYEGGHKKEVEKISDEFWEYWTSL